ncbi:hypothetical protein BDW59DRAFT_149096 [Aspergillus cavernicola]|uniref:NACHT domain-containing protein n=1 Tax=Aspergillus cavernicola TaxID=176166 RepID=A0ABR4I544_9EURO
MAAATTVGIPNLEAVFQEAYRLFRESLPENVRAQLQEYDTVDAMTLAIEAQIQTTTDRLHKTRLHRCLDRFNSLGRLVNPYFQIVDIFVQTNPQYIGLFWGSLRLLFKLSSNYIEYLEKLAAMFANMAGCLPVYENFLETFSTAIVEKGKRLPPRLAQSLVDIYVDVMRFCYRALRLFGAKCQAGLRFTTSIIGRLAWKPFDKEFEDILARFETHRQLFEFEVTFAMHSEAVRFYERYDEDVKRRGEIEGLRRKEGEANLKEFEESNLKASLASRMREIGYWINPPNWKDRYEERSNLRVDGTGAWIVHESVYLSWRANTKPILSIQGKPGFGKSTLCPIVIDDLSASPERASAVCYFFFHKQLGQQSKELAFRSLLVQLLDRYREDPKAIDIASAIFDKKNLGQRHATMNEILAILELFLAQFPGAKMVVDAVDECSESEDFLECLDLVTGNFSTCSFVYFTRPTVALPDSMQGQAYILDLKGFHNTVDMELFLRPRLQSWVRKGMLPSSSSLDGQIDSIVGRSNGLFLWIGLLMAFLGSRRLSIMQRLNALDNLNRLEGLDKLFHEISVNIEDGLSEMEGVNIKRAFQWALGAHRPPTVEELQVAIAIPLDRSITDMDIVPDFEDSIGSFSGGLLEVTAHRTVQFIHVSAREFFTTLETSPSQDRHASMLHSSEAEIQLGIAITMLSYLVYSIPAHPLSGDPNVAATRYAVNQKYPLLEYTATWWSGHAVAALEAIHHAPQTDRVHHHFERFRGLFARLLSTKNSILLWLEACLVLENPPALCPLPDILLQMPEPAGIRKLTNDYLQVSEHINTLMNDWAYLLEEEPNEVWGDNIAAFAQSNFWGQSEHSYVTVLSSPQSQSHLSIQLMSQTSSDGQMVGSLYLVPPSSILHRSSLLDSSGWEGRYDVWNVSSYDHLVSLSWILDARALQVVLPKYAKGQFKPALKFRFPSAISDDLQELAALNLFIHVGLSDIQRGQSPNSLSVRYFNLDVFQRAPPCPRTLNDDSLQLKIWPMSTGRVVVTFRHAGGIFPSKNKKIHSHECYLQFFFDPNSGNAKPFGFASWTIDIPSVSSRAYLTQGLKFHPHKSLVAFHVFTPFGQYPPVHARTCLWNFESSLTSSTHGQSNFPGLRYAYDGVIEHMEFSPDGQFIYGNDLESGLPIIVKVEEDNVSPRHQLTPRRVPGHHRKQQEQQILPSSSQEKAYQDQRITSASENLPQLFTQANAPPATQQLGSFRFDQGEDGNSQVSQLSQLEGKGSIILRTMGADGTLREQILSRLPERLKSISVPTIIHPTPTSLSDSSRNRPDCVKILLNKAQQTHYSLGDMGEVSLPAVVERAWETIPTVTTVLGKKRFLDGGLRE